MPLIYYRADAPNLLRARVKLAIPKINRKKPNIDRIKPTGSSHNASDALIPSMAKLTTQVEEAQHTTQLSVALVRPTRNAPVPTAEAPWILVFFEHLEIPKSVQRTIAEAISTPARHCRRR